ncbi:MAG: hypothetical protein HY321_08140 [Armatimonadetes bacterium]|nr:hypothetical protein [Armatimonadota bacterium]
MRIRRVGLLVALAAGAAALAAEAGWAQAGQIPSVGTLRVAALRIEFDPDVPPRPPVGQPQAPQLPATLFQAQHTQQFFRDVLAEVREYFQEVSLGKLDVQTGIVGPVAQATQYDRDSVYYGADGAEDARLGELTSLAITQSENTVDFRQYDLIIVFHAGRGQESDFAAANTNLILSRALRTPVVASGRTFPGVIVQSVSEMALAGNQQPSIVGRLCMSILSLIGPGAQRTGATARGLPDENHYVGYWDIMDRGWMLGPTLPASGRYNWATPAHPNPLVKMQMGWLTPVVLKNNQPNTEIPQVETTGTVYQLWSAGAPGQEYFLLENRQKYGFDAYIPEAGLLVWHINEAQPDQSNPQNLRVRLLQADGRNDIGAQRNPGDRSDPFPGQLSTTRLDDSTPVNTRDSIGRPTFVSVTDISNAAQIMRASLYIVPPMILGVTPAANFTTESVTPTFRATFSSGIDPNSISIAIDKNTVVDRNSLARYYNSATRQITYRASQLAFAQHTINISVRNEAGTVSESTGDRVFRVNFRTVPAGLRMVSVPYVLSAPDNDPGVVFGAGSIALARWHPVKGRYFTYPDLESSLNPPADDSDNPTRKVARPPAGLAYWINLSTDSPTRVTGDQVESVSYRIPLFNGWNMIGNPFPYAVDWNGLQVEYRDQTRTLQEAVALGWMSGSIYTYQPGGYTWSTAPEGQLFPWEGYWVKVKVSDWPVTLIVPPVASGTGALRSAGLPGAAADGWRLRLAARAQSGAADTFNFIGVARSARDGDDAADVEKPPVPRGGTVALRLIQGGRSLAQDLRAADVGSGKSWDVEVDTDLVKQKVTLAWPDLSQLPETCDLTLEDLATGRRVYARTQGGYTYDSGQGGPRRFRLTASPRDHAPLSISGVSVQRTRGVPSVRFTLNRDASIAVEVMDPSGKVQRELTTQQNGRAGLNVVSTGRSDGLTAGIYLVRVRATASDGASVAAVMPLVVVR